MRDRVEAMLGGALGGVWVATFHSTCVRILRRYIDRIGFENNFTIYDSEDQKSVIKEICKRLQIDTKLYRERFFMAEISAAKDEMLSPVDYALKAQGDQRMQKVAEVYKEYQRQLFDNNALDFDDLICRTVELFQSCPEVLEQYQERFRFIMVDEYQDTNTAQFKLVSLLVAKYRNLCVVGDDDQSIYRFRGANIGNILNFEQFFPDAEVIRLEQNYRSTQNILNAANAVISHNKGRKEKTLWTDNGEGEKIRFRQFMNSFEEAEYVAGIISQKVGAGKWKYGDCAILYRTNAQSRMFEEKFLYANVPYKIVGGVNFYSRKEIKDVIAYLKTIANGKDDLAVRRIINVPKRGIGATTISRVQDYATEHGASFYDALRVAETIPGIGKSVAKLQAFVQMIQVLRTKQEFYKVKSLIEDILEQTGYMKELQAEGTDEALDRMANVDELLNKAALYDEKTENPTLDGFLEEVALVADIDNLEEDADHVVMMTLHSAKGLEFPVVFMVGMEDGVFPSYISISSEDESELEEERRLCYVGITRARTNLFLTSAKQRMVRGEIHYNRVSRFVDDIPEEFMAENERAKIPQKEKKDLPETKAHAAYRQMRENFKTKIMAQQQFEVKKADGLSYNVGDRVRHIKFGNGTVTNIAEGGRDYEVTVNFDRVGVKKMFASFAKLVKTEN